MNNNRFSSIFWDFGGVITSSPFEAFNSFEENNDIPEDFIRKVNSINPNENAWAQLEQSKISLKEFDDLFAKESKNLEEKFKVVKFCLCFKARLDQKLCKQLKNLKV